MKGILHYVLPRQLDQNLMTKSILDCGDRVKNGAKRGAPRTIEGCDSDALRRINPIDHPFRLDTDVGTTINNFLVLTSGELGGGSISDVALNNSSRVELFKAEVA